MRSVASISLTRPPSRTAPTATIRSAAMPTSARRRGAPVPSIRRPLRMTRSTSATASGLPDDADAAVRHLPDLLPHPALAPPVRQLACLLQDAAEDGRLERTKPPRPDHEQVHLVALGVVDEDLGGFALVDHRLDHSDLVLLGNRAGLVHDRLRLLVEHIARLA